MDPHRADAIVRVVTLGRLSALLLATMLAAAACTAASESPSGPAGETPGASATLPIGESLEPEPTEPDSTAIPGFDGWDLVSPKAVELGETPTGFGMILDRAVQWSKASKGVLFFTTIDGDFRLDATVRTTKTSDSSVPPGGDGSTQLAGVMARLPGTPENWLFFAVGADGPSLAIDRLVTRDGQTAIDGRDWADSQAELKICRVGTGFEFWYRPADTEEDWIKAGTAERKDLAGELQVGAALSADGPPDLTALFDDLIVEPMEPGEDC
jgi:hypothetical protein